MPYDVIFKTYRNCIEIISTALSSCIFLSRETLTLCDEADDRVRVVQGRAVLGPAAAHAGGRRPLPVLGKHGPVELHHVEGKPADLLPLHGASGPLIPPTEKRVGVHPGLRTQNQIHQEKKRNGTLHLQSLHDSSFAAREWCRWDAGPGFYTRPSPQVVKRHVSNGWRVCVWSTEALKELKVTSLLFIETSASLYRPRCEKLDSPQLWLLLCCILQITLIRTRDNNIG